MVLLFLLHVLILQLVLSFESRTGGQLLTTSTVGLVCVGCSYVHVQVLQSACCINIKNINIAVAGRGACPSTRYLNLAACSISSASYEYCTV